MLRVQACHTFQASHETQVILAGKICQVGCPKLGWPEWSGWPELASLASAGQEGQTYQINLTCSRTPKDPGRDEHTNFLRVG